MRFKSDKANIAPRLGRLLGWLIAIIAVSLPQAIAQAGPREEAVALFQQGIENQNKGDYKRAAEFYERALKPAERAFGPDHPNVGTLLNNLANVYLQQGRYGEAESVLKRALAIAERTLGPDKPELVTSLTNLAILCVYQGRYAEAEPLFKRALAIREKALGSDHPDIAGSLDNLANLYYEQGRTVEAEALYKRALAIQEKSLGPDHRDVAVSLNNLGNVYKRQGRYGEAEPLLRRALAIREKALGPDHPDVAVGLGNLAGLYKGQGRYAEAEALFKRALAIMEKALGPDHPDVASSLANLAVIYNDQGRTAEAEPLYKRALAIREKALGPDHTYVAQSFGHLAVLYAGQGRYAEAEPLFKRALAIREKALGPDHPSVANDLNNLASLHDQQGRYAEAEPLFKRSLAIREKALGADHPDVAQSLGNLAGLYDRQGRTAEALGASRRAVAILTKSIAQNTGDLTSGTASAQQKTRPAFLQLVHVLSRAPTKANSPAPEIVDEAFRAAQYAGGIETAQALAGMAARFAAGSDALAALVRERQDLSSRWQALDAALVKALSQAPDKRNPTAEAALRRDQTEIEAKLKVADERLRADFPRFAELAAAKPVSVADIQSVLGPQEAFVAWTFDDDEGYLFAIRKDRAAFIKIDMTRSQAAEAVQTLRGSFINASPVDLGKAYDLYKRLLAPAESLIADAKHLIIVPDGALQSLPPAVLITAPPTGPIEKLSDYKSVAWLIRRQALTVLPAASSLVSLRRFAEARHAQVAFIGFGDPDFRGDGSARGVNTAALYRGAEADSERLRGLPRLVETADELRAQAKALGAPASSLHLGADASVTNVERLDLSNTRVIAFATHGLIAGDLPTLAEPALALSPPARPSAEDDGLLRASQVSQLKLNADFVVLSACNTAAPDGKPGAEGLSGLAKAFFYAGARSLLVSHWPVDSDATVKLTTGLFRAIEADPSIGRAEALRRSILALIDAAPANSDEAHPASWAPFVLAGEGGANR